MSSWVAGISILAMVAFLANLEAVVGLFERISDHFTKDVSILVRVRTGDDPTMFLRLVNNTDRPIGIASIVLKVSSPAFQILLKESEEPEIAQIDQIPIGGVVSRSWKLAPPNSSLSTVNLSADTQHKLADIRLQVVVTTVDGTIHTKKLTKSDSYTVALEGYRNDIT